MKPLFPVYCKALGYVILFIALILPFSLFMTGVITDSNLSYYKECTKLLMIFGCIMIIFAYSKKENKETEQIRNTAARNAIFYTALFIFANMLYQVFNGNYSYTISSSFLTYLIVHVISLEYGLKKASIDKIFKS